MKKPLLFIAMIFFLNCLKSQDIIVQTNGDEIQSKVTEVNISDIKYYKFGYLDGPVYTIDKKSVFMIKYANGTKDIIQNINVSGYHDGYDNKNNNQPPANTDLASSPPKNNSDILNQKVFSDYDNYMAQAKKLRRAGGASLGLGLGVLLPAGIACTVIGAYYSNNPDYDIYGVDQNAGPATTYVAVGIASMALGLAGLIAGSIDLHKAHGFKKKALESKRNSLSLTPYMNGYPMHSSSIVLPDVGIKLSF